MRETKDQKIARLGRVCEKQVADIKDMKGELKSLQKRNTQLEAENKGLQARLDDADELNEQLQSQLRVEESEHRADVARLEAVVSRLEMRINQLEKQGQQNPKDILKHIADIKSGTTINDVALQLFESGSLYYDNTIFNLANAEFGPNTSPDGLLEKFKENKKPFFSPDDLIIRINPRTGIELDKEVVDYIIELLSNDVQYEMALCELGDYSCFNDGDKLMAYAYSKGLELLGLYEEEVFG